MRRVRVCLPLILGLWLVPGSAAASGWLAPVTLSDAGQNVDTPQVAVDADGDAVAVWMRYDGSKLRVQAATRPAGGSWSTPVNVSDAGQDAYDQQVVITPAGNATAIWRRSDGVHTLVQAATRPAGGSWTTPDTLSDAGENATYPDLAVGANGGATAVWLRSDGSHTRMQAATRPAGGAWTSPVYVSDAGQTAYEPLVAVDADGDATAIWNQSDGSHNRVLAATRPASGAWTTPDTLSDAGQNANYHQVAVGANGDATAVWRRSDGTYTRVEATTRPAGGAWATPAAVSAAGQHADSPQVAVDADGDVTAVWRRHDGSNNVAQAATRPAGGAWTTAATLSATGQDVYGPTVAVNSDGDATAVWYRSDGTNERVQAATRAGGGAWTTPVTLSASGQHGTQQQVAIGASGDATAVWQRSDGTNTRVQAATLDATKPSLSSTLPTTAKTGEAVAFSATASDVWSSVTTSWNFGDGASATGTSTSHTYTAAGTYTVTVTATDAAGNARTVTGQLTVTAPPTPTGDTPPATPPNTGGTTPGTTPDTSRRAPVQLPASLLTFPPSRGCVSAPTLTVELTPRAGVTYRQARVELTAGKKTITRTVTPRTVGAKAKKRTVIPVSLKGLPRGSLRLKITVTTADEHVLTANRAYRTCTVKAKERRAGR